MSNSGASSVVFIPRLRTLAAALSIALVSGGAAINADAHPEHHRLGRSVHLHNELGKEHPRSHHKAGQHLDFHNLLDALNNLKQSASAMNAPTRAPTTRVITSHSDSGPGSLRDALSSAVDGDVIDLGQVRGRIALGSALTPSASVTIKGPGQALLTIDGGAHDRVFSTGHSLKVSNVTIANGATPHASLPVGGCIFDGANLYLSHVSLDNCKVGSPDVPYAYGGAIAALGYTTLKYSSVTNSSATAYGLAAGGGVVAVGQAPTNTFSGYGLLVYQTTISGNSATVTSNPYNYYAIGAGVTTVYNGTDYISTVGVIYSTISNNSVSAPGYYGATYSYYAKGRGGGLFSRGQAVITAFSTITGNSVAVNGTSFGGGVYAGNAEVTYAVGMRISGNTVSSTFGTYSHVGYWAYGGGLMTNGSAVVEQSVISGNTVTSDCAICFSTGGGVTARGDLTLTYSTVSGNGIANTKYTYYGRVYGGGAFSAGSGGLTVTNSTISGNTATGSNYGGAFGGGLAAQSPYYYNPTTYTGYFRPTPMVVSNTTVAFNSALYGGGIMVGYYGAPTTLQSSIVSNNTENAYSDIDSFDTNTIMGDHNIVMSAYSTVLLPGDTIAADPVLLPLAYNGGPTQTHALDPTSPAIDAGSNPLNLTNDQRGCTGGPPVLACASFPRVLGAAADIGAFELDPDQIFIANFDNL